MNTSTWNKLTADLPRDVWRRAKRLLYLDPVGWVVQGLVPEESADDPSSFYLWLFRMPLYVPSDVIDLSWSERFGGGSTRFDLSSDSARRAVSEAAAIVEKEMDRSDIVLDPPGGADNVRMQEARAYGLLLQGRDEAAVEVLGRVLRYQPKYEWEEELISRSEEMKRHLVEGQRDEALNSLEKWRDETMAALGIA